MLRPIKSKRDVLDWKTQEAVLVMRREIAGLVFMLAGCGAQPNYILVVMTTFKLNGGATENDSH
ncbi:MAG TPA: hypothetical protein VIY68_11630 [Steroidobacteraceae bacterium]